MKKRIFYSLLLTVIVASSAISQTCSSPVNLSSTVLNNSVVLTWDSVPGAKAYFVKINRIGTWKSIHKFSATNSLTLNYLRPCNDYQFVVIAKCDSGHSSFSARDTFATMGCVTCDAPEGLTATVDTNTIELKWNSVANANRYIIEIKRVGNPFHHFWRKIFVADTTKTFFHVPSGETIIWRVRAKCSYKFSMPSAVDTFTTPVYKVASSEEILPQSEIKIYPNPAESYVNVEGSGIEFLKIYDIHGKLLREITQNEADLGVTSIEVNDLENGTYLIAIMQAGKITTKRFMISR